jgi:hypothetical protein
MHLLQSGVAFSVIALWLGHESTITTHRYVEADLVDEGQGTGEASRTRNNNVPLSPSR